METLTLKGKPRERGLAHGEHFRRQIGELAEIRRELLFQKLESIAPADLETIARRHLEPLKKAPMLYDELMGISDGSKLTLTDLIILNNYTDLRDFDRPKELTERREEGCSAFAVWNKKGRIVGQTWDMHASAEAYIFRMRVVEPDSGLSTEIFTVAGCLALAGVNSQGVGVFINNLHSHETAFGLIWPGVVRGMLNFGSALEAIQWMREHPPSSGHNYLVTDSSGFYNIETTGVRINESGSLTSPGILFHTNHYLGPLGETEITKRVSPTTHSRFLGLENYFEGSPFDSLTMDRLALDLCAANSPANTCITIDPKGPLAHDPHAGATCGSILFDETTKSGMMFQGAYDPSKSKQIARFAF